MRDVVPNPFGAPAVRSRLGGIWAAVLALSCVGDADEPVTRYLAAELLFVAPAEQDHWIGRAQTFAVDGDRVLVVDHDRGVHLLDLKSGSWRILAPVGGGPGEVRRPFRASFVDDEIWVSDPGNGRVTKLSRTGSFKESVPVDLPFFFATDSESRLVVRAADSGYLLAVTTADSIWGIGPVPALPRHFHEIPASAFMQPNFILFETVPGNRFVIAENHAATLWVGSVGADFVDLQQVHIPARIQRRIIETTARLSAAYGGWAPAFGTLHALDDGTVWVRPAPIGILGFVVDPDERRIVAVVELSDADEARGAMDSTIRGDSLLVLTETDIRAYRLQASIE